MTQPLFLQILLILLVHFFMLSVLDLISNCQDVNMLNLDGEHG